MIAAPPSPPVPTGTPAWKLWLMFAIVLLLALGLLTRGWRASLLDRYEFRQLQTAVSTYWIAQDGWRLAYPTPLFGPPWSVPMEFPTYQLIVAHWHDITGMALEQSGRLISMVFIFAMLPALYDLLALARLPPSRRLIVLAVVMSTPVYLFYARAFMIETTALCLAVWFLAALRRSLLRFHPGWIAATTLLAALAALTKITTFVVFAIPAVGLVLARLRATRNEQPPSSLLRLMLTAAVPALVAFGATWWWVHFSDQIKNSNPLTGFLNSHELRRWNFGDWSLRSEWSYWIHLQENIVRHILAEGALVLALLAAVFASRALRIITSVLLLGFMAGPLIFANLYHLHDYYYSANAVLLSSAAGLLLASCWDDPRLPRRANWLMLGLVLTCQFYAYYRDYYTHIRDAAPPPPRLAEVIQQSVPTHGVVLIYGADWNPRLPYYAQRRAIMIPTGREDEIQILDDVMRQLPSKKIDALVIQGEPLTNRIDFVQARATRFGLKDTPFFQAEGFTLYLPADAPSDSSGAGSAGSPAMTGENDSFALALKPQPTGSLDLTMVTPAPTALRTLYGFTNGPLDNGQVLNAHAPCELEIKPPTGASHIEAIVGLHDEAYALNQSAMTDGVSVDIMEISAAGIRSLFHRDLQPGTNPKDRGAQTIAINWVPSPQSRLLFRIGTGAQGSPTNDWAYWAKIAVR